LSAIRDAVNSLGKELDAIAGREQMAALDPPAGP
jgi:hypothetical protein